MGSRELGLVGFVFRFPNNKGDMQQPKAWGKAIEYGYDSLSTVSKRKRSILKCCRVHTCVLTTATQSGCETALSSASQSWLEGRQSRL